METLYEKAYENIRMDQCEEAYRKGFNAGYREGYTEGRIKGSKDCSLGLIEVVDALITAMDATKTVLMNCRSKNGKET